MSSNKGGNIYNQYVDLTNEYKQKYGENTVVLMMVGGFYEIYSNGNDDIDIFGVASSCNLIVSKKAKGDIYMAGMPVDSLNRYSSVLIENNYVCIVVSQIDPKDPSNRQVTDIISPSINMYGQNNTNYFTVLYLEDYKGLLYAGITAIDVSTGRTVVLESLSTISDPGKAMDEVQRTISTYLPQEVILISKTNFNQKKTIEESIEPLCKIIHRKWDAEDISQYENITYQEAVLKKAFKYNGLMSVFEYIGMERLNWARVALCFGIQFAYEHNAFIINDLQKPIVIDNNNYLTIEYDSCIQLNLQSLNNRDKSVVSIINRCSTPFGKRMFKDRLFNPITDIDKLQERYDAIEKALSFPLENIHAILHKVLDLERLLRKIVLKRITPMDWNNLIMSLDNCKEAFIQCNLNADAFMNIEKSYYVFDTDECSKYSNILDIKSNIFRRGIYSDIDEASDRYERDYAYLNDLAKRITSLKDNDSTLCKIDNSNKDGFFLTITKNRFETAASINKELMGQFTKKFSNQSKTMYMLSSNEIVKYSNDMDDCVKEINQLVQDRYYEYLDDFIAKHSSPLKELIDSITELDVTVCLARNAKEWGLSKPIVKHGDSSYLDIHGLRHPIIEFVNNGVQYVKNDVYLNKEGRNGMLLYGINSSGKSSLMKALGLNIIMVQAGMYGFCDSIEFCPYYNIMTRIAGNDNIYRGMSTFIVEISELRNILNRGSNKSLVLGDEICSGTENTSALSIVASSIHHLIKKGCSFVFATHLHELLDIPIIQEMTQLYVGHLSIDTSNDTIVYERKIKDGPGSSIYGIEVCRYLKLPLEFMKMAEDIRKQIKGESRHLVENKTSNYNSKIIMDMCMLCNNNKAVHTHHIKYQKDCENDYEKNQRYNLMPLCEECHEKEHHTNLHIVGYKDTINGAEVEVVENTNEKPDIVLNEEKLNKIRLYVRFGKCNRWFIRHRKTGAFKQCDEEDAMNKLKKLGYDYKESFKEDLYDTYL
eukprot:763077-Hanusia_phi.AAC.6